MLFVVQGSVEFLESNEFRIEVNVTSPNIHDLARFHYNYTDYHGSVLLQLVSVQRTDVFIELRIIVQFRI